MPSENRPTSWRPDRARAACPRRQPDPRRRQLQPVDEPEHADHRGRDRCPGRGSRCRGSRCRPRRGSRAHGRPRPSRRWPRTSCHITSGCSGLPKLRQLTSPSGRAPTHARFIAASATTSAVPRRGSSAHHRWLPSTVRARPRPVSVPLVGCFSRSTVASPPGPSTVLRKSWWSYWLNTHDGSASRRAGPSPRQRGRTGGGRQRLLAAGDRRARPSAARRGGHLRRGELAGMSARTSPSRRSSTRNRPVPVTLPMTDALISHFRHTLNSSSRCWGSTMASIRSWLSLIMISNGSMPVLADVDLGEVEVHPDAALGRRLAGRARDARGAEVLDPDHEARVEDLEAGLDQALLLERVTDLHARALGPRRPHRSRPMRGRSRRRCRRARSPTRTAR